MPNSFLKRTFKQTLYKSYLNQKGSFTYFGEKVFFPKGSTTFMLAMRDGIYEHDILKFLLNFLKDDSVYIDIGANIGLMSIPVLHRNRSVKVVSFEASPNTFAFLERTRDQSKFKDRWVIYDNAVSNNNEEMDFFIADNAAGAYESMRDTGRIEFSKKIKVPGITIDEVWNELGKPLVSVIKSDIEGADLLALKGTVSCMNSCRPVIITEWNRINIEAFKFGHDDLLDFCNDNHYKCYAVPSLVSVTNATELEMHSVVTENYLLVPEC